MRVTDIRNIWLRRFALILLCVVALTWLTVTALYLFIEPVLIHGRDVLCELRDTIVDVAECARDVWRQP